MAVLSLSLTVMSSVGVAQARNSSNGSNSSPRTDLQCVESHNAAAQKMRPRLERLVVKGTIPRHSAQEVLCDPVKAAEKAASQPVTVVVKNRDVSALADGCGEGWKRRRSANLIRTAGSPAIGETKVTLSWCWNKKKHRVKEWVGNCTGDTTAFGSATMWVWDGCKNQEYIPYRLNGYSQGGIHYRASGYFDSRLAAIPQFRNGPINVWGHYDGTCDHTGADGVVYRYC